jgi:hypothetical protein
MNLVHGEGAGFDPRAAWDEIVSGQTNPETLPRRRLQVLAQWMDPHGIWSDEASRAEGYDPVTKEDLLEKMSEWRNDSLVGEFNKIKTPAANDAPRGK